MCCEPLIVTCSCDRMTISPFMAWLMTSSPAAPQGKAGVSQKKGTCFRHQESSSLPFVAVSPSLRERFFLRMFEFIRWLMMRCRRLATSSICRCTSATTSCMPAIFAFNKSDRGQLSHTCKTVQGGTAAVAAVKGSERQVKDRQ